MPVRKSKQPQKQESKLSLESTIAYNVQILKGEPEGTYEETRKIVCPFYKGGNNPECVGCLQADETLQECKDDYLDRIESRPMEVWDASFSALEVREKQKVSEIVGMGLNCDSCYLSDSCPLYKKHSLCAIDWEEEGDLTPKKVVAKLIDIQFKRVNRGSKIEEIDGGVPDQTLSTEIDRLTALTQTQNDLNLDKFAISIKGESQSGGSGLLASLLGRGNQHDKTPAALPETQDIPYTPIMDNLEKVEKIKK